MSLCVLIEMGGGGNVKMNNFIAKKIKIQKATFDATKLPIISSFQATVAWVERENHCIQSLNTFYLSSSCSSYQQQIDPLHFGGWIISEHLRADQSSMFEANRGIQSPK